MKSISSIILSGDGSRRFARQLFSPSRNDNKNISDQQIIIQKETNGFTADIKDLDLSFLDINQEIWERKVYSMVAE